MSSKTKKHLLPLDAYCADTSTKCDQITDDFVEKRKILLEETDEDKISDTNQITDNQNKCEKRKHKDTDQSSQNNSKHEKSNEKHKKRKKSKKDDKMQKYEASKEDQNILKIKEEPEGFVEGLIGTDGEIPVKEERILEEGELPEDIDEPSVDPDTSHIHKTKPIDYDEFNRKRKVALLLSYCGAGFHGMQKNPDVETIELKLLEALTAIKAIREEHKTDYLVKNQNSISFQRAARTDKGVSAARQVVSLKIIANDNFLEEVNKHLPPEIQVFGIERVTKKFDSKCLCSGRNYEYLVPSFAFAPSKDIMDGSYRLPTSQFEKINKILGWYVGTHNFHNFTSGKRFQEKSAIRYITVFKANQPFECRGHEFVALEVAGQSFMIHQIRKMVGLCIAICRGYCGEEIVKKAWQALKLDIPKAPGLGLLLNRVHFDQYNRKVLATGERNSLTFDYAELHVGKFKIEKIWHMIIEEEIKKSCIVQWLKTLQNHTYSEAGMSLPQPSFKGAPGFFPPNGK